MNAPTKSDLQAAGYRVSVNIADAVVSRCASDVKAAYLLAHVTEADITASGGNDSIGEAWRTLTVLRIIQDNEFATRVPLIEAENNRQNERIKALENRAS